MFTIHRNGFNYWLIGTPVLFCLVHRLLLISLEFFFSTSWQTTSSVGIFWNLLGWTTALIFFCPMLLILWHTFRWLIHLCLTTSFLRSFCHIIHVGQILQYPQISVFLRFGHWTSTKLIMTKSIISLILLTGVNYGNFVILKIFLNCWTLSFFRYVRWGAQGNRHLAKGGVHRLIHCLARNAN